MVEIRGGMRPRTQQKDRASQRGLRATEIVLVPPTYLTTRTPFMPDMA